MNRPGLTASFMAGKKRPGKAMVPPSVAAAMVNGGDSARGKNKNNVPADNAPVPFPVLQVNYNHEVDSDLVKDQLAFGEKLKDLLANTPFYVKPAKQNHQNQKGFEYMLERYSDRYNKNTSMERLSSIPSPHWLFPDELLWSNQAAANRLSNPKEFNFSMALDKLKRAEGDDHLDGVEKEGNEGEEDQDDEEVYEEEELEDETDYNLSYFDNGEDDYGDGGGDEGEPSY